MSDADELIRLAESRGGKVMGVKPTEAQAIYDCGCSSFEAVPWPTCSIHNLPIIWRNPGKPKKKSKYGNVRCEWNGYKFDSKAEMEYGKMLAAMEADGTILAWQPQPRFRLGVAENIYVADFQVYRRIETHFTHTYAVDVKGKRTAKFERDIKLWRRFGPCELWIVHGKSVETIWGKRR